MSDVVRISVPVNTRAPTGQTNAYLLGDDPAVLVDPAGRTEELDDAVDTRSVGHVAVTHTHPDHIGAVEYYADETGATVWARYGREGRFEAATGVDPDRTLRDGDVLPGTDVSVVDTPGHAVDHVAFETADGIVCGDLAVASGSVVVGGREGDLRAYLTSLRRIRTRSPPRLYPGHGPVVDDPRGVCERLIRHRLDREAHVLQAVDAGHAELDAVVDAAYDKNLTGVRDLAVVTVEAHLEKLAVEGRVQWDGRRASTVAESD